MDNSRRLSGMAVAVALFIGCWTGLFSPPAFGADITDNPRELTFSMDNPDENQPAFRVLRTAYTAIGIKIRLIALPRARSLLASNSGNTDGEVGRVGEIAKDYPNLIRIDVPIVANVFCAYTTKDKAGLIRNLDDLKSVKKIGVVRGAFQPEKITEGWSNVESTRSYESALLMLKAGRIDALFGPRYITNEAARRVQLDPSELACSPLIEEAGYHFLNVKNADLVPRIADALAKIRGKHRYAVDGLNEVTK